MEKFFKAQEDTPLKAESPFKPSRVSWLSAPELTTVNSF